MANERRGNILDFIQKNAIGVAVVICVLLIFIPMPKFLIDVSMVLNIAFSLLILLQVIYTPRASDFQTFPRVVLMETMFGLAINISSTRLILASPARASGYSPSQSAVVQAFANIVAGNNLVIGFVIFVVLIVVQVLVITKGATRVSEVAARFSLDSMNMKLIDINDRVNSGSIDAEEGEKLKAAIRREIDFYSAMDGSSKFVSGNTKAGIFITAINLIGGFIIGMVFNKMNFNSALETYSILTIGDGLTSQIPSLIISFSTGLLVTGTKSDEKFDQQLKNNFGTDGQIYIILGLLLVVMGALLRSHTEFYLVPIGGFLIYFGLRFTREKAKDDERKASEAKSQAMANQAQMAKNAEKIVMLDPLTLEIGFELIPLVNKENGAELLERITRIREAARLDMGVDIPSIRIVDNMTLPPNDYSFKIQGIEAGHSTVRVGYVMCMDTGTVTEVLKGERTKEPSFGMDAIWVPEDLRSEAENAGYTVIDPPTVISTHITEILRSHAAEMIDRQAVSEILNKVKEKNPVLVSEVLETAKITYGEIEKVFQNLLEEKVSIRNYVTILETMANYANVTQHDVWAMTNKVREALGKQICSQYADSDTKKLQVMRLSQELSELVAKYAVFPNDGSKPFVAFDPVDRRRWLNAVNASLGRINQLGLMPIILCVSDVRQLVYSSLEREMPGIVVISDIEIYKAGGGISVEIIDEISDEGN